MQDGNKLLYIIAGANGSGKSTLAEVLLKEKHLEFLNADEIALLDLMILSREFDYFISLIL